MLLSIFEHKCQLAELTTTLETGVAWYLETFPIVFNHNVTLKCTTKINCCDSGSWQWTGGRNDKSISYNEGSTDKLKYDARKREDGVELVIQNFDVHDANKTYSCSYGFIEFTANLTVYDYEFRPSNDTMKTSLNISDHVIMIDIYLSQVYPKPMCNFTLDAISIKPTVYSHFSDPFYQVNISAHYTLNNKICGGQLKLLCVVGTYTVNIADVEVGNKSCSDPEMKTNMENSVQISVAGICIGVVFAVVLGECTATSRT